jgi:acetylornithine deacetylase
MAQSEPRILANLLDYLSIDTVSPRERDAFAFLHRYLRESGFETSEQSIHAGVLSHRHACPCPPSRVVDGSSANLRARLDVDDTPLLLVSCHVDVVPAPHWPQAFEPRLEGRVVHGRGACDTKGNLIMVAEAVRFLRESGIPLVKSIQLDAVVEEEIGGNGALSTTLFPMNAPSAVLVLEPTSLKVYRGHRGCIGFTLSIRSDGAHMGAGRFSVGPVQAAARLVLELEQLEKQFIDEAHREAVFGAHPRPIQINVGRIEGGEWHGTSVDNCRLMVNLGFPTGRDVDSMMVFVEDLVSRARDSAPHLSFDVVFDGIRNDSYIGPADSELLVELDRARTAAGLRSEPADAWHASCDARIYAKSLRVPTVVFGCGHLQHAHSNHEQLAIDELVQGIRVMASYLAARAI